MYKCLECGKVFEEPCYWSESRGEFWGFPCSEEVSGCPHCKGGYEEAFECEFCGNFFVESEINGKACSDCVKEYATFDVCWEIGENNPDTIKINSLLMSFFDEAEIEDILKKIIIERELNKDCSCFIENDIDWFVEELVKEVFKK